LITIGACAAAGPARANAATDAAAKISLRMFPPRYFCGTRDTRPRNPYASRTNTEKRTGLPLPL
jgi:hypothetical protein